MKNKLIKIKNYIISDYLAVSLFFGLAVFLLWQMLLPGYILTLDMIFTPNVKILLGQGFFYNNLPLKYLFKFLNLILEGWVIQKIIILSLFFLIGYLAYKFLPLPQNKKVAAYWAGLFFTVNPFVYTRFLAGHYMHLFAYALLPVFISFLLKFFKDRSWKNTAWLFSAIILIGIFSLHFLVMIFLIFIFYFIYQIIFKIIKKDFCSLKDIVIKMTVGFLLFAVFSSYWILPYILSKEESVLADFNQQNLEEFKTVSDQNFSTALNVLLLYGFWGEQKPWSNYFLWPKDNFVFWLIISILLYAIIIFGAFSGLRDKNKRKTIFFILVAIFSFIFSCGVGQTIFKSFNQWLFDNFWFWSGFRDSQKWSAFLVLSYAYFGSIGVISLTDKLKKIIPLQTKYFLILFAIIPALYTYTIWGGFSRQLKPVWYPQSWHKVNEILNEDKSEFNVLFLPWHQYLSLKFNQNLITINPAQEFFDKNIIQGENVELGKIFSQGSLEINSKIQDILIEYEQRPYQESVKMLAENKVKYIIFSHDLDGVEGSDRFIPYDSEYTIKIFNSDDLTLYKIL